MTNETYVQTITNDREAQQKVLAVLAQYGDNHWWESQDMRTIAYYQLHEPVLVLADFSRFHKAVELLLHRPVQTYEFAYVKHLQQEAQKAWQGK